MNEFSMALLGVLFDDEMIPYKEVTHVVVQVDCLRHHIHPNDFFAASDSEWYEF